MPEISPALYRAGEGEPLVLIHGFTATWRCWLPIVGELVPRFEVIAPTLPGHDGGPGVDPDNRPWGYAGLADRLEEMLDELGIETAHLVGNSLGGGLAFELAKRGRARSVVGISPAGGIRREDREEAERIRKLFARTQAMTRRSARWLPRIMARPGLRRLALRDVMAYGDQVPAREALQLALSSIRCELVDDVFAVLRSGDAALDGLERIDCPVLVVWGSRDRILPLQRHAPRLRAEIPNLEYRVLPGLGHTPMWDDPNLIASTIADFAERASAEAAAREAEVATTRKAARGRPETDEKQAETTAA
jgi:pimeloyl-ACP methyl ester carboxylesterase